MKTIRDLTDRVEEAHTRHLREVKSLEEQTRSVSANPVASPQLLNQSTVGGDTNVSFESLVQGGKTNVDALNNNDMFGALVNGISSSVMTPQKSTASANSSSWSSPTLAPAPIKPQQQTTSLNTNGWSSQQPKTNTWTSTPINPIASPQQQTNKTSNWSSSQTSSSTLSSWTQSIKPTTSAQQYPNMTSPPSFGMNQMPLNNNSNNANYNALRTMSASTTSQQPAMSSSMGLLKPISPSTQSSTKSGSQQTAKVNLHAFDPLG
jgi:SCY1-like protein 2